MAEEQARPSISERAAAAVRLAQNGIKAMTSENTLQSIVERATAAVTLRPAIGQGTDTTTVCLRDGVMCDVEEGPWEIAADLDPQLGGSQKHPGPGFLLRAAMGTCFAQTAALWAAKLGVPLDRVDVEVDAHHDARGLLGVDGTDPRFTRLRYRITIESPAPEEDVQRVLDAARAHSPVHDSLGHALTIERDVQVVMSESP
ncbi:OsmC family protein [Longibacter sp.]|uniref:OsmC family protein n=1 Tax=Longibacter sp. TaxID=2045415 RepID=UPI003EBEA09E